MNINKKIEEAYKAFSYIHKPTSEDGENRIVILNDNAPQEIKDSVYKVHGERFPSDFVFSSYARILDKMSEYDMNKTDALCDHQSEIVDSLVSIYTSELTKWLASDIYNVFYLDEVVEDGTIDSGGDSVGGIALLQMAQYKAIDEVYNEVMNMLTSK